MKRSADAIISLSEIETTLPDYSIAQGVEDETFACGTGIVASCISAFKYGVKPHRTDTDGRVGYEVKALKDSLAVDFIPQSSGEGTAVIDIWLTGPVSRIAKIDYFCTNI